MDIKAYIKSGILEQYVFGTLNSREIDEVEKYLGLFDELRLELMRIEVALEAYAMENSIPPRAQLKGMLLNVIDNLKLEQEIDLSNLPLISKHSNYKKWLQAVKNLPINKMDSDGRHVTVLRHDSQVTQMFLVSTTNIEQETHLIEHESFLILEGECKCTVGDDITMMKAGDYMQIPLFEPHEVELISPKVTAILQRVRI